MAGLKNKGAVTEIVALAMVALLAMSGLALDGGRLYALRTQLENVADAAALAGAQALPDDPALAQSLAVSYAENNGLPADHIQVSFADQNHEIFVQVWEETDLRFMPVVGIRVATVRASSGALVAAPHGLRGAVPIGVADTNFQMGQLYQLKVGAGGSNCGESDNGNFHALALGSDDDGNGASVYEDNLIHGYGGWLNVGDLVYTKTGDMSKATQDGVDTRIAEDPLATYDHYSPDSPRLLYVPVVSSYDDINGHKRVKILGFAAFFLEDYQSGSCGDAIVGRFVHAFTESEIDGKDVSNQDFGLRVVKLIPGQASSAGQ